MFCWCSLSVEPSLYFFVSRMMPNLSGLFPFKKRKRRMASLLNCRGRIGDAEWGQIRALLADGRSVSEIARLSRCSRDSVRRCRKCPVPPSSRVRKPPSNSSPRRRSITARRRRVLSLCRKTRVVIGRKVVWQRGRPRKDGRARPFANVERQLEKVMFPSPAAIARQLALEGHHSKSRSTIRRDLLHLGMKSYSRPKTPAVTQTERAYRQTFARKVLRMPIRDRRRILFSDEKKFDSNDHGTASQWCNPEKRDEQLIPREYSQNAPSCLVWIAIGVNRRFLKIVKYEGRGMDHTDYVRECLKPAKRLLVNRILMQDGATCHWTQKVRDTLGRWNVDVLEGWPSHSPDLNPAENVWAMLGKCVSDRGPWGEDQLIQYIREEFEKIPQETIDKLVLSFETRCREVIVAAGGVIKR